MLAYLRRLVTTGAAYQAAEILAKGIAVFTLPLYTRHVSTADYGTYNSLLTAVILFSILLRLGVGEAFVRFYFTDTDEARRTRIARTATATVAWTTTLASLLAVAFASQLSRLLLGYSDAGLMYCAILGLWAFTNIEMVYAQLRVDARARTYMRASGANVAMTVVFTISLVVFAEQGARGLLLGNFGASAIVVLALWWVLRARVSLRVKLADLRAMLHFGLPTVPADASVYALQVADRFYLLRGVGAGVAGEYAISVQLATVVFVFVRGFQYAWPPLAYSIDSDAEASRLYSLVTTYFVLATGIVVVGVALLGRWLVRLLAAPEYYGAYRALPWLALGWTLYGLYQVMIAITGRARVTQRNLPAAAAGLIVNVVLLFVLVPDSGLGLGLAGAGLALCGAYAVMVAVMHLLTRGVFAVEFQWRRLGQLTAILALVAVSGDLLLPTSGIAGLLTRVAWLALVPALLLVTRFVAPHERAQVRALWVEGRRRVVAFRAGHGDVEAYAEDPLKTSDPLFEATDAVELLRKAARTKGPAGSGRCGQRMPELSTTSPRPAGVRERRRRAEALRAHRADARVQSMASAGELAYLRAQLTLAARLTARLAATHDVDELVGIVVQELHGTFAFYLAAIQRLDDDGVLRLVAGSGALAEVMTEFLLVEQSVRHGINGRVARSGETSLVSDTRADRDYIVRDPNTDPRSELSVPIVVDGSVWGVLNIEAAEVGAFGEADAVLVETIAASLGSAIHRAGLVADLERTFTTTLSALMSTVEAKDDYTASHEEDVAEMAERVALRMGLSSSHARDVRYAALLHDVGKVAVPSEILLKPGPLTDAEWVQMRRHTIVGGDLVARIDAFAHLAPAVRASHERWDGDGYPDGISGEEIPLAARIIAVCDTYDAIVTDRPYRPARTIVQARAELCRVAGIQLDARVVEALLEELAAR